MNKTLFLSLLLLLSTSATAQPRRRPAPSQPTTAQPSRKLVETVKTRDGREIRLYDDMSYEIVRSATPGAPSTVTVNITAGVITNAGDVKPVVRKEFLIFKEDIAEALGTVTDQEGKPLTIFSFYLADRFQALEDQARIYTAAVDKLKPLTLATVTTDFSGSATVEVPAVGGPYWIYGVSQEVLRTACWWYLKVEPHKSTTVVLDNNNAVSCG